MATRFESETSTQLLRVESVMTPDHPLVFSTEPLLPPELIDATIDHLHDDKQSLQACSLVCKTWTRCARFHLFSKLRLLGTDIKRFSGSATAVIPFIRRLHLAELRWHEILAIWSRPVPDLPAQRLNSLPLSALFHTFFATVELRLHAVRFPTKDHLFRFICAFPHLQRLAVHHCFFRDLKSNLPSIPTTFSLSPHLRVLELDCICRDHVLDWFLSLPDRPALRAVGLRPSQTNNFDTISRLLLALENSLESLLICTTVADPGSVWPFDLRLNTCLRSIQIEFDNSDDAGLVTQILSQISPPHIEEVGLEIRTGEDDEVGQLRWDEIDAALQRSAFSGLKTVNIRVVESPEPADSIPTAVSWVVDHMPLCNSRGILHVWQADAQYSYLFPQ